MASQRVASRYAKSILELAKERGVVEEVRKDMILFTSVCEENHDFALMLKNPIVTHGKKRSILHAIFAGKVSDLTIGMFDLIVRKHRENDLELLAKSFEVQYMVSEGIESAHVSTTFSLDDNLRKSFTEAVKTISEKEVDLKESIDADLIGGFLLKIGDKQIDASLKSKLRDLRQELTK